MAEELKTIDTVDTSPFKKLVMTIGELPTSFVESMTYYECLAWLVNFLETQVIPAVNNNGEAVEELQGLFIELKNYVDTYFDNLDVQDEIDNKLDDMVEAGTFDTIINQEIFGEINARLDLLDHRKYVLVGDSYLGGYDGSSTVHSWGYFFKSLNGISDSDCYIWYESGAGFVREGADHNYNFKKLIQAKLGTISNADEITDFVIAGGVNDNSYSTSDITSAMSSCLEYVKTNFPNARIYVGCIGNKSKSSDLSARQAMAVRVLDVYKKCINYGAKYLTNIEMIAHDWSNYGTDGVHMLESAYQKIGGALMSTMDSAYSYYVGAHIASLNAGGSITDSAKTIDIEEYYMGYTKNFAIKEFNLNDFTAFSQSGTDIKFTDDAEVDKTYYLRRVFQRIPAVECELELTFSDSQYNGYYAGSIMIDNNGALIFHTNSTVNGKTISGIRLRYPVSFEVNALLC